MANSKAKSRSAPEQPHHTAKASASGAKPHEPIANAWHSDSKNRRNVAKHSAAAANAAKGQVESDNVVYKAHPVSRSVDPWGVERPYEPKSHNGAKKAQNAAKAKTKGAAAATQASASAAATPAAASSAPAAKAKPAKASKPAKTAKAAPEKETVSKTRSSKSRKKETAAAEANAAPAARASKRSTRSAKATVNVSKTPDNAPVSDAERAIIQRFKALMKNESSNANNTALGGAGGNSIIGVGVGAGASAATAKAGSSKGPIGSSSSLPTSQLSSGTFVGNSDGSESTSTLSPNIPFSQTITTTQGQGSISSDQFMYDSLGDYQPNGSGTVKTTEVKVMIKRRRIFQRTDEKEAENPPLYETVTTTQLINDDGDLVQSKQEISQSTGTQASASTDEASASATAAQEAKAEVKPEATEVKEGKEASPEAKPVTPVAPAAKTLEKDKAAAPAPVPAPQDTTATVTTVPVTTAQVTTDKDTATAAADGKPEVDHTINILAAPDPVLIAAAMAAGYIAAPNGKTVTPPASKASKAKAGGKAKKAAKSAAPAPVTVAAPTGDASTVAHAAAQAGNVAGKAPSTQVAQSAAQTKTSAPAKNAGAVAKAAQNQENSKAEPVENDSFGDDEEEQVLTPNWSQLKEGETQSDLQPDIDLRLTPVSSGSDSLEFIEFHPHHSRLLKHDREVVVSELLTTSAKLKAMSKPYINR